MSELKDKIHELIDGLDEIELDRNPLFEYYPEKSSFHISTIFEDECEPRKYAAWVSFDTVIDTFIEAYVRGDVDMICDQEAIEATLFVKQLREAANKIEAKICNDEVSKQVKSLSIASKSAAEAMEKLSGPAVTILGGKLSGDLIRPMHPECELSKQIKDVNNG